MTSQGFIRAIAAATLAAVLVVFTLMALPAQADDSPAPPAQTIKSFTLDNGMQVVLVPDNRSPVVVHMVWYDAGAVDEPEGQTGIAHMLEHMMFKGTDNVPPGEFSKRVAKLGGRDNAFTGQDYTAYYQKIGRDNLTQVVELEADRIANLNISDEHFQPERDVVLEERSSRTDNNPIALFYEKFNHYHFPDHPYGDPIIGWRKDIENYTLENAIDWYKKFYAPENAIVVFAGALAMDEAQWLTSRYYGGLENPAVKPERPEITPQPLFEAPKRFEHTDPRAQLPLFVRSYRAPGLHAGIAGADAPSQKDAAALLILADVLGGGLTSRLYQTLVMDRELADSARAGYRPLQRYEASLSVIVQPREGVRVKKIERAVNKVIEDFLDEGLTEDELKRVKMQAKSADVFARDDLFQAAYRLGQWLTVGGTIESYQNWLDSIEAVTVADVRRMANLVLNREQSTTGILHPGEGQQ